MTLRSFHKSDVWKVTDHSPLIYVIAKYEIFIALWQSERHMKAYN